MLTSIRSKLNTRSYNKGMAAVNRRVKFHVRNRMMDELYDPIWNVVWLECVDNVEADLLTKYYDSE